MSSSLWTAAQQDQCGLSQRLCGAILVFLPCFFVLNQRQPLLLVRLASHQDWDPYAEKSLPYSNCLFFGINRQVLSKSIG